VQRRRRPADRDGARRRSVLGARRVLRPQSQLYGRFARIFDERGDEFFPGEVSWSEADLVQATARQPGARAYYVLDETALAQRVRERTVADMVASAPTRLAPSELPFAAPAGAVVAVRVAAAITHTVGGLRVDTRGRTSVDGLWAAGADVGGIATGGYASGLASALVLALAAVEDYADVV
jgi:succinate dehydrogenase/fumarate reductase flavoprotein subunit